MTQMTNFFTYFNGSVLQTSFQPQKKKTNYILFHHRNSQIQFDLSLNISIHNFPIIRVSSVTFLGVFLDENFSWLNHMQYIKSKVSKIIGVISRLCHYVDSRTSLT